MFFVRFNAAGELRIVSNFNSTETQSSAIPYTTVPYGWSSALFAANVVRNISLVIGYDRVDLWVANETGDTVLAGTLNRPVDQHAFTSAAALPAVMRIINSASAPSVATQARFGNLTIHTGGSQNSVPYATAQAVSANNISQGLASALLGSTGNIANSAAPANATLSNTAAGYSRIGGQFAFVAVAGAETDYALFAYQAPAVAVAAFNKGLIIKGLRIDTFNTGAAVATTATVLEWFLGYGATAVSLATAEAAATKAPRRIYAGTQTFAVGAAIGAMAQTVTLDLSADPVYVPPGQFLHIIVRMPIATATASQVIRGGVAVMGSWT